MSTRQESGYNFLLMVGGGVLLLALLAYLNKKPVGTPANTVLLAQR